jgi:hypothetical protein
MGKIWVTKCTLIETIIQSIQRKVFVLFARLISHQPAVLFSQNKSATSNQPTVLFSQNKPAPAISHQPTEQALCQGESREATQKEHNCYQLLHMLSIIMLFVLFTPVTPEFEDKLKC